jgi:hypothetical protein
MFRKFTILCLASIFTAGAVWAQDAANANNAGGGAENAAVSEITDTGTSNPATTTDASATDSGFIESLVTADSKPHASGLQFVPLNLDGFTRNANVLPLDAEGFTRDSKGLKRDSDDSSLETGSFMLGVPAASTSSRITIGVLGTDVDNFVSASSFQDVSYEKTFGEIGFDDRALSIGVSRKFLGAVTSIYYNGNIIDDMFAIIANNENSGKRLELSSLNDLKGADFDLKDGLDELGTGTVLSKTNIQLLLGIGIVGIKLGYNQDLSGGVTDTTGSIGKAADNENDAIFKLEGTDANLDNALAPSVEFGFHFIVGKKKDVIMRMNVGAQVDIHSYREFYKGSTMRVANYYSDPDPSNWEDSIEEDVVTKTVGDYIQPIGVLRFEWEFPTDEKSRIAIGIETGFKMKFYSNLNDKGKLVKGKYTSTKTGPLGVNGYTYAVTESPFDINIIGRPSVRYITSIGRLSLGIHGAVDLTGDLLLGENTKTYDFESYQAYTDAKTKSAMDAALISETTKTRVDLAVKPLLGIGVSYAITTGFLLNAGVGAEQTLYKFTPIGVDTTDGVDVSIGNQTWGAPTALLSLGATFKFKETAALDAMFSANGIDLGKAKFVVQFSGKI